MFFGHIPELLIILFVILLIFGGRKLPALGRGIGESIQQFKKQTQSIDEPKKDPTKD